jgi:ABC-type transport system involved in multi-copper enzyme maturation permease subunit
MNSLTYMVYWVERWVVNLLVGWVIVLLSVIATAFFIPNMLRRGSVELLLSKPISRSRLLLFKYLGGLAFVFVNSAVLIGGVYVLVGLKTGIWAHGFLLTILLLTYFFAILYSISTLLAVLTQSTVVCILLSIKCWFLLLLVGWLHSPGEGSQGRSPAQKVVNGLHAVLPRPLELGKLTEQFLSKELLSDAERKARGLDEPLQTSWAEALGVSTAFIAVMLGLACWRFSAKDP